MIARLLDHTHVQTTARYANLANDSVKASGFSMGDSIGMHIAASEGVAAQPSTCSAKAPNP